MTIQQIHRKDLAEKVIRAAGILLTEAEQVEIHKRAQKGEFDHVWPVSKQVNVSS